MSKVFGLTERYTPFSDETSRVVFAYGVEPVDDKNSTWREVFFYKKQHPNLTIDDIKNAIISDINTETDEKILRGFMWHNINVWLSSENQFNFKAAYDLAVQTNGANLPIKFKLGEADIEVGKNEYGMPIREKQPIYHTFETVEELTDFYTKAITHINQCLNEGWEMKDNIDWSQYEINTTEA